MSKAQEVCPSCQWLWQGIRSTEMTASPIPAISQKRHQTGSLGRAGAFTVAHSYDCLAGFHMPRVDAALKGYARFWSERGSTPRLLYTISSYDYRSRAAENIDR